MRIVPMSIIRQRAENCGSHWFERATLRFFHSRVAGQGYEHADGRVFFVSSECREPGETPRLYSVRVQTTDGHIDTVGAFQAHHTNRQAACAARNAARS